MQVNEKCDVYALGIMLWEALTGSRPYAGLQPVQVMHQIEARRLRSQDWLPLPRACPPAMASFVRSCWHAKKAHRLSSDDVRRCLAALRALCCRCAACMFV